MRRPSVARRRSTARAEAGTVRLTVSAGTRGGILTGIRVLTSPYCARCLDSKALINARTIGGEQGLSAGFVRMYSVVLSSEGRGDEYAVDYPAAVYKDIPAATRDVS